MPTKRKAGKDHAKAKQPAEAGEEAFSWCSERQCPVAGRALAKGELIFASAPPLCAVQAAHNRPVSLACARCHAPLASTSESLGLATGDFQPAEIIGTAAAAAAAAAAATTKKLPLLPCLEGDAAADPTAAAVVAAAAVADGRSTARCTKSLNEEFFFCSQRCFDAAVEGSGGCRLLCAHTVDEGHPCNQLQEMCCIDAIALAARHFAAAVAAAEARGVRDGAALAAAVGAACAPLFAEQRATPPWWAQLADDDDDDDDNNDDDDLLEDEGEADADADAERQEKEAEQREEEDDEDEEEAGAPSCAQLKALARRSWEMLLQGMAMNSAVGVPTKAGGGGGGGGVREAELSAALQKESATGSALGKGLAQGVSLARSLAQTNAQLREAFDALAEQRDELEAQHGMLMLENTSQRERLGLLELTLAMESYPTELPGSIREKVEAQLRSAATEVVVALADAGRGAPASAEKSACSRSARRG